MKCPKCHKNMEYKRYTDNYYYYECPYCHYAIGKPENSNGGTEEAKEE